MIKKIIVFIIILSLIIFKVEALNINDCDVLASLKLQSSLDEDTYICKNTNYGKKEDSIYYDSVENIIYLNNSNIYYMSNYGNSLTMNISGDNIINLLNLDKNITITGNGKIKFREDSYVKKTENGEKVYRYIYNNSIVVDSNKKIYEGTLIDFAKQYQSLKANNTLPEDFKEEDYTLIQAPDFVNMTPVSITPSWIGTYITTELDSTVEEGYGVLKPKEIKKEEEKKETLETQKEETKEQKEETKEQPTTLKTEKVTLISSKKLKKKYTLKVDDLSSKKEKYNKKISEGKMLNLYDISIKKGKKTVNIKDTNYTIKIKLDDIELDKYENYQIVYIDDKGNVSEYITGEIEGDYIVFKTPHLSQYGVVGKEIEKKEIEKENKPKEKIVIKKKDSQGTFLKISLLISIIIISITSIIIISYKSKKALKKGKTTKKWFFVK